MRGYAFKDFPQVVENLEEGKLKLDNFPLAGILRYFYDAWSSFTKDLLVLEITRVDHALPFIRRPELRVSLLETSRSSTPEKRTALWQRFSPF